MGLFNRLFGQKPPPDAPPERVGESVATMEQYLRGIMSHYGDAHFQGDTQAKQILSVYSFGGVSALAIQHQMSPPQAHAVCLALFTKFFGFEPADAANKAEAVITAAPARHHIFIVSSIEVRVVSCIGSSTQTMEPLRISPRLWRISRRQRHEG